MRRLRILRTLGAALAVLAAAGCGWLSGRGAEIAPYTTRDRSPVPSETPLPPPPLSPASATPAPAPSAPLPSPGEEQRPGSPAAWGESAMIGAGRSFDPIRFSAGSDELDLEAQRMLRENAQWLRANPRVWLVVEGHCDASSSPRYAYAMGMSRALAVQDFLDAQGVTALHVFCVSYGNDRPVAPGNDADANALNNRAQLVPFLQPQGIADPSPVAAGGKNAPQSAKPAEQNPGAELPR